MDLELQYQLMCYQFFFKLLILVLAIIVSSILLIKVSEYLNTEYHHYPYKDS